MVGPVVRDPYLNPNNPPKNRNPRYFSINQSFNQSINQSINQSNAQKNHPKIKLWQDNHEDINLIKNKKLKNYLTSLIYLILIKSLWKS